jgi:hypothetical protein
MKKVATAQDFLKNGRVNSYPKKREKLDLVLGHLIFKFDRARMYSEREINEILHNNITYRDYVFFRRELVDHGYLVRTRDGRQYRRNK